MPDQVCESARVQLRSDKYGLLEPVGLHLIAPSRRQRRNRPSAVPTVDVLEERHRRGIRIGLPVLGEKQLFSRAVGQRGVKQFNEVLYRAHGQSVVQNCGYWIIGDARRSFPSYEPSAFFFRIRFFGGHGMDFPFSSRWVG